MKTPLLAICIIALTGMSVSRAAVIASDDFNSYDDGNTTLDGGTGGTGFSSGWNVSNQINVTGGVLTTRPFNDPLATRTLSAPIADTGTLWISFDWGYTSAPGANDFSGLTLFDNVGGDGDGGQRLFIGKDTRNVAEDPTSFWGVTGGGISDTFTSVLSHDGMKTGVAKITMGTGATDTIELWVGATGSPVNVSGTADLTVSGFNIQGVETVRILGDNITDSQFDNLIIGTTMADVDAIPEPSVLLLSGLGSLLLLRRRRW